MLKRRITRRKVLDVVGLSLHLIQSAHNFYLLYGLESEPVSQSSSESIATVESAKK